MTLIDRDRALLDFAGRWYRLPGAQAEAIVVELGMTATAFWQRVNTLIDRPDALAYAPMTVGRLRRLREDRLRARSVRGLLA